jgi:ribosomal protein L5
VGSEAYAIFGAFFKKKYKIMNTEWGMKMNICLEREKKEQQITNLKKWQIPQTSQNPEETWYFY